MAKSTTTSSDQSSRGSETSLPHSRTMALNTPIATRSQRALTATQRPAPSSGPPDTAVPMVSRPVDSVLRTAAPDVLDPVNQPATTRIRPSQASTCQPRSR